MPPIKLKSNLPARHSLRLQKTTLTIVALHFLMLPSIVPLQADEISVRANRKIAQEEGVPDTQKVETSIPGEVKASPSQSTKGRTTIKVNNVSVTRKAERKPPSAKAPLHIEALFREATEDTELTVPEVPPSPRHIKSKEQLKAEFVVIDSKPEVAYRVEPHYPRIAKRAGVEGSVNLKVLIDEDGNVIDAKILSEVPRNVGFGEAAIAAVRQWKYKPAYQGDKPVKVWIGLNIPFKFDD